MGPKGKKQEAKTAGTFVGEPRRNDLLWKELLARFFVPMLRSVLPDLAGDIDEGRNVVFLDVEDEATGLRLDVSDRHGI